MHYYRSLSVALGIIFISLLECAPGHAAVVYVNKNASGAVHDGASWATAFTAVQPAVDAAASGDEIWVAASAPAAPAYVENVAISKSVALYGGFAGTETQRSQRDWKANPTILDGGGGQYVITTPSSGDQAINIDGFTVQNSSTFGIEIYSGTAVISNCSVCKNDYGIDIDRGTATIANCTISGNPHGGIYVINSDSSTIRNCVISGSVDGVYMHSCLSTNISNCTISGNSYGLYLDPKSATVSNCTISRNSCGIWVRGCVVSIANSIVAFNTKGISLDATASSTVTTSHNDVYGNTATDFENLPNPTGTNGNICADPMLSNQYHDIHIQPTSPCVDAGDDTAVQTGWTDIDGQQRITGSHVDIGSDESDGTAWSVPSRIWHVSPNGSDSSDGLTWATAKCTLAGAVAATQGSDEVWVAKGEYVTWVSLPAGVTLYGGFSGTETERNQRDWKTNTTVLKLSTQSIYPVITCSTTGNAIDGFTIRNAKTGVYVSGDAKSIANCIITGSTTGVYVDYRASAILSGCTISDNGKGISSAGSLTVANSIFSGNTSDGIYQDYGPASLTNNTFCGNGGGVYLYNASGSIINCTICGSSSYGVWVSGSTASIANCILAFNESGLHADSSSATTFTHNDVFGNTTNYAGISDLTGTNGNVCADPLFVERTIADYHLLSGSPCIDAGDDTLVTPGETDLDGNPRKLGAHVDMGACEFTVPGYVTLADAALALRAAAGLSVLDQQGLARLNVATDGASANELDLLDAVRLARKAAGLDGNP